MTEETIFEVALGMQTGAERSAYLDQACGGDLVLRRCVESLLDAHANLGNFLEQPAVKQLVAASPLRADASAGAQADIVAATAPAATIPDAQRGQPPLEPGACDLTDWSAGQPILDYYVVEKELGRGGMGKVYLVRDRSTGQLFAVKRALPYDEGIRRKFLAELQTWTKLPEHPHLVAYRFFRTPGDEVVIFADFVEGGSLKALIQQRRLRSLEQILDVAIQFAWGL